MFAAGFGHLRQVEVAAHVERPAGIQIQALPTTNTHSQRRSEKNAPL